MIACYVENLFVLRMTMQLKIWCIFTAATAAMER